MINIPNILTVFRFSIIPLLIIFLGKKYFLSALIIFLIASLSDKLDGYIARKFRMETLIGAYMDPVADKLLIISAISTLLYLEVIPTWFAFILIFRDILIMGGIGILKFFAYKIEIDPTILGKLSTFMQMTTIVSILIIHYFFISNDRFWSFTIESLYFLTTLVTILSLFQYLYRGIHIIRNAE